LLSVFVKEPQFQGQTKEKLVSGEVTALVSQFLTDQLGKFFEEDVSLTVEDAVAVLDEGAAEGLGEVTFPGSGWAEEHDVIVGGEEAAGGELEDEATIELLVEGEVEAIERFVGVAELGLFQAAGEQAIGATGELVVEEEREEVGERELIGLALHESRFEVVGDSAEAELAECANELGELHRHWSPSSVGGRPWSRSR